MPATSRAMPLAFMAELAVLQVDVMHDLAKGGERRVCQAGSSEQHLEGTAVAGHA